MSSTALVHTPSSQQVQRVNSSSQNAVAISRQGVAPATTSASNQNITPAAQSSPAVRTPQQLLQRPVRASTPGKWEHPRMAEILRRQHLSTFDKTNIQRIIYSALAILLAMFLPGFAGKQLPRTITQTLPAETMWPVYVFQCVMLLNIGRALMPLSRAKDNIEDIPLTPQQRTLLNLPPMSRSATPQEQAAWVTPPRYSRNGTPNSMDSLIVNARGTPLSGRGSPREGFSSSTPSTSMYSANTRPGSGSPYAASPLAGRTPDAARSRRDSSGSGRASPVGEKDIFGTPQTSKNSRASTGLNNKWLYDRGKASPTPSSFLGTGWGSGSVFN